MQSTHLARTASQAINRSFLRRSTVFSRAHSSVPISSVLFSTPTRRNQNQNRPVHGKPPTPSASSSPSKSQSRTFLNIFRTSDRPPPPPPPPRPLYSQEDLFHVLESSPVVQLQRRARLIKDLAPCPTCLEEVHAKGHAKGQEEGGATTTTTTTAPPTPAKEPPQVNKVSHPCPSCGFPTHCSEGHYLQGQAAHGEYCERLREINEDEHDLRSGRLVSEFELPGMSPVVVVCF